MLWLISMQASKHKDGSGSHMESVCNNISIDFPYFWALTVCAFVIPDRDNTLHQACKSSEVALVVRWK